MGNSPLHASTVRLIRNLGTNHVSPQFHLLYADLFETVHSGEEEIPRNWPELVVMHKFKSSYDESAWTPELAPEWLSPEEKEAQANQYRLQREQLSPPTDSVGQKQGDHPVPDIEPPGSTQAGNGQPEIDQHNEELLEGEPVDSSREIPPSLPRRFTRASRQVTKYTFDTQHSYIAVKKYYKALCKALTGASGQTYNNRYLLALMIDPEFGLCENMNAITLLRCSHRLKSSMTKALTHPTSTKLSVVHTKKHSCLQ